MYRVLIVDDEKSIRVSLKEFLLAAGYKVDVAADAPAALRLLSDCPFDIVVSDIVLPGINGIELLQAIRGATPFAQVVMITGEPTVDTAAAALRSGAFDYLTKPVGKNAILRVVGNAAKVKALDDERRRLEAENLRYQAGLERLVNRRTAELSATNAQLKKAMGDLTQAQSEIIRNERLNALAQLAAGICHDFNNVLMPIRGLADHLVTHPDVLDDKAATMRMLQTIIDEKKPSAVFDAAKVFYRLFHGCEDLTCIDLHGTEISLPLDLNQPIELNRQFDVTVNNGLAEHVFLAGQVFDSMHRHTKPGGLMIHEAPLISGWLDHGFYNFQPTLFFDLARANDYTMAFFVGGGKPARVHQLSSREKVHEFVKSGRLPPDPAAMVVFRKGEEDTPFALPIQHAYADKAPDSLA